MLEAAFPPSASAIACHKLVKTDTAAERPSGNGRRLGLLTMAAGTQKVSSRSGKRVFIVERDGPDQSSCPARTQTPVCF